MTTSVHDLELPALDLIDVPFDEAQSVLQGLAAESWLARNPFGYTVLRYDDVAAVLRDKRWHNAAAIIPQMAGVTNEEFLARQRVSILSAEGDVHMRLRRLVAPAFSPRAADRLRPFMREVVNGLVDAVARTGQADIAVDICEPYPIPIICELLGAPRDDWQLFSRLAEDVLRIFNGNFEEDLPIIMRAQDELDDYVRGLIAARRARPADDLITALIAAEEAGDRLDTAELVTMVGAVIVGGTDTTRNQLGCSVALLAEHPEQWALLAERPELASRAVDETMRCFGAVRGTGRFASEDIEYRDVLFPAGTLLMPSMSVANRDPAVFADAATFDITREPSSQPNLTLGSGIHYCLGASLAKAELQEALPLLARRLPDLAIDGAITWKPSNVGIFGAEHLPVTFAPGH
ncbi:MAG: cytochrome [Ilumatobacteraceae bacterium]|nr:cytochrome [Ilumatobacteraceae bacterium]